MITTRKVGALLAFLVIAIGMIAASGRAHAQCPKVTVVNNTSYALTLNLYDGTGAVSSNVVAGGGASTNIGVFSPVGAISGAGIKYAFLPPPPSVVCTPCIALISAPPETSIICATVCWDPLTCIISIGNCAAPCNP